MHIYTKVESIIIGNVPILNFRDTVDTLCLKDGIFKSGSILGLTKKQAKPCVLVKTNFILCHTAALIE